MGTLVDDYLRALRDALGHRLPPAALAARLREAEGHLHAAASEFGEAEAVARFGTVRRVAGGIVRAHRGYAHCSAARLGWPVGVALFVAVAVPAVWLQLTLTLPPQAALDAFVRWPSIALTLFFLRTVQTRRWLASSCALWLIAAGFVTVGANFVFPIRPDPSTIPAARREVATWETNARGVAAWRAGHPPLDFAPQASRIEGSVYLPLLPFAISRSSEPDAWGVAVQSPDAARRGWTRYGDLWAANIERRLAQARETLAFAESSEPAYPSLETTLGLLLPIPFYSFGLLALVNAVGLGWGDLLDLRRPRRTRAIESEGWSSQDWRRPPLG